RKLLPALYYLHRDRHLHPQTRILALARARHEPEAYRRLVRRHVSQHVASADFSEDSWGSFSARLDYMPLDISQRLEFARLARHPADGPGRARGFYRAPLPDLCAPPALHLHGAGLVDDQARLVLRKPLGDSLATARRVHDQLRSVFDESRVFRI